MKFNSTVEVLSEHDILIDSSENCVVRFSPSELINDTYKSNHSIKFVQSGYEEYDVEGKYEKLNRGETMFVNGDRKVSAQSCGEAVAIFLEDELIGDISRVLYGSVPDAEILNKCNTQRINSENFNSLWNRLFANPEIELTEEFYYEVGTNYITSFLTEPDIRSRIALKTDIGISKAFENLITAKTFLFDNIENRLTLEEIAREAATSKFYLLRSFKMLFGVTPLRLHTWLRLNRAKELIRTNKFSITEVAHQLDYSDLASFSKQFKQVIGESPSQFLASRKDQ